MKLKGGVIIIGSLIWENHLVKEDKDNIRKDWRSQNLIDNRILTKVPIRYGRKSQTRKDTYTMVFSKSCESNLGQGLILSFNEEVTSFEILERQTIALAIAEGIYKKDNLRFTSNWGSIGLLFNPKLMQQDIASYELIKKKWTNIYYSYRDTFLSDKYRTKEESESVITQDGFLNINWQPDMNEFDLLIATPVIPRPKSFLSSVKIAQKIKDKNYPKYFKHNRDNKIYTSADEEIQKELDKVDDSNLL